jgi:hypothetical protein
VKLRSTENRLHIYKRPCCTPAGADPDTNRSAGLHSLRGFGRDCLRVGLAEFTSCRSDLSMHLREHVYRGGTKEIGSRVDRSGAVFKPRTRTAPAPVGARVR